MIRRDVIIAVFATAFCMSTLYVLLPTKSSQTIRPYNPLVDVNDDGTINIVDLALVAIHFSASGDPMNKSEFVRKGYVNEPWWDSGWTACSEGLNTYYFNRTLDSFDVLVYLMGRNTSQNSPHQIYYGGDANVLYHAGVWWQDLTNRSIVINRQDDDPYWNEVRIMLWKIGN